ncbi:hypothetical protein [Streptacidiphilus monticola]|uniref:Uncharacterized protein n=1 Tax=Streptacidiphilus monticola TaxID=2161674 RepID=A0ABW1G1U8_9ACTN
MRLPGAVEKAETVEVVRIHDYERVGLRDVVRGEVIARWGAAEIGAFRTVIAQVPESAMFLCFEPGWGVRVHGAAGFLFEAAFCFNCDRVRWWGPRIPSEDWGSTFKADSPAGQQLLGLFRACLPAGAEPPGVE